MDDICKTIGVNNLNYRLVDERFDMVNRFRLFNILRKKLAYTKLSKPEEIKKVFEVSHWDNGVYALVAKNKNIIDNEKEFVILINPKAEKISLELDDYFTEFNGVDDNRAINVKNSFLPGCSIKMLFLKK